MVEHFTDPTDPIAQVVRQLLAGAKRYPPADDPWELAAYPASGTTCMFFDGWLSQASSQHLATTFSRHVANLESPFVRFPVTSAYSYAGERRTYSYRHTLRDIENLAAEAANILRKAPPNTTVCAYSMGGTVALLGLDTLLTDLGSQLRSIIPLVVLIHPAIGGAEDLAAYLQDAGAMIFGQLPLLVLGLAHPEWEHPRQAREVIPRLLDSGIAVCLLRCPADKLAPCPPIADKRLWSREFALADPTDRREQYREHIRLRSFGEALDTVYHFTKPLYTWESR